MFCMQCGNQIENNDTFCGYCGRNVVSDIQEVNKATKIKSKKTPVIIAVSVSLILILAGTVVFFFTRTSETFADEESEAIQQEETLIANNDNEVEPNAADNEDDPPPANIEDDPAPVAVIPTPANINPTPEVYATPNAGAEMPTVRVGDIIQFGRFDWLILDISDDMMLIITNDTIESRAYNRDRHTVSTWAESYMREYLNGDFFYSFDDTDRARIIEVINVTPDNPWFGTDGGPDTQDYIFLLSLDEVVRYFGDSGQLQNGNPNNQNYIDDEFNSNRISYHVGGRYQNMWGDSYSVSEGATSWWWLRSPGGLSNMRIDVNGPADVHGEGRIHVSGGIARSDGDGGVRPAMWVSLSGFNVPTE